MTTVPFDSPAAVGLDGEIGVDDARARGGARARRHHPGRRAVSARDHRELVRAGRGTVVEIGCAAALEGSTLVLGGAGVGRGQVGVVVGTAE